MSKEPYILTPPPDSSGTIHFDDDESNHLIRVLRAGLGDEFVAFDGSGRLWKVEITALRRTAVEARVIEERFEPERAPRITVAVAAVKATRMDWAVEKAAELGAIRFVPLETRYSVVEPGQGKLKRWRTIALSAAKQIRHARVMEVSESLPLKSYLSVVKAVQDEILFMLLDEKEASVTMQRAWSAKPEADEIVLFIGPEGGWAPEERMALQEAGAISVTIGSSIVRTETAVVVGLGILMQPKDEG